MTRPATVTDLHDQAEEIASAAPMLHLELTPALVAAINELGVIEKSRTADAGSYSYGYADLADVVSEVKPVLNNHGLAVRTPVHALGDGLAVTVKILHVSGETLDDDPLPFPRGANAQATGSAITYFRRYALLASLNLATGDDDDGARAVPAPPRQASAPPPADQPKHPLRVECDLLEDDGEVWQSFLTRAGVADGDADMVLTDHPTWREWLSGAIEHHRAGEQSS